ncbi:MAG: hypothetical protein ACI832_003672, partial [Rheinheimera aquimaris]
FLKIFNFLSKPPGDCVFAAPRGMARIIGRF